MTDPLEAILAPGELRASLFPTTSRYYGLEIARLETPSGRSIAYVRRRFAPPPEKLALLLEHTVVAGDRLDNIAGRYLGDPEQFWRICDANRALRAEESTETVGRRLRITLPDGLPGSPDA
jgi:nucleoid-associated protein YgaU